MVAVFRVPLAEPQPSSICSCSPAFKFQRAATHEKVDESVLLAFSKHQRERQGWDFLATDPAFPKAKHSQLYCDTNE